MTDIETAIEIVRTTTPCHTLPRQSKAVMAGKVLVQRIRELEAELAEIKKNEKEVSEWIDGLHVTSLPDREYPGLMDMDKKIKEIGGNDG